MALSRETRRLLILADFAVANTWRYLLKSLWLFFPPLIFLVLAHFTFWHLEQGKDIMVITLIPESGFTTGVYACFILALIFWVYVTWYSTRLVANAKDFETKNDNPIWEVFRVQSPRIIAFTCITVVLLGIGQLPVWKFPLAPELSYVLLILSFPLYFYVYHFWSRFLHRKGKGKTQLPFLKKVRYGVYSVLAAGFIVTIILHDRFALLLYVMGIQLLLVLLMILRRELDEVKLEVAGVKDLNPHHVIPRSSFRKKFRHIIFEDRRKSYFRGFCWISSVAFAVYIATICSVTVAVKIGSFPFTLLAFGVLLGIGNFISFTSVLVRFNFHLLIFVIAFILGNFTDPHYATVIKREESQPQFSERQGLREFFLNWLNDAQRKDSIAAIMNDPDRKYPVYFVMANGGASRSGYWTSGALASLEYNTNGEFSKHLFCLSGASGGSVGTSTFFMLLRHNKELQEKNIPIIEAATDYMDSDFLSFTLSHMLGPDILRHIFPFLNYFVINRAGALAHSLEKAPNKECFLYNKFSAPFTDLITRKGHTDYHLPILCINTVRMQDSSPAVISNINIDSTNERDNYFNNRLDVLGLLKGDKDMKLSTAVVLGASFPYISPAGRIDAMKIKEDTALHKKDTLIECQYFVDGGYFDNSGAGVVNEMMIAMNNLLKKDTAFARYKDKLEFHVLHISNNEPKLSKRTPINPMINDLLSPVRTIMGSYGTQTTINDQRLKNYLYSLYDNNSHYNNIDLYENKQTLKFSMNWVISYRQKELMNKTLDQNPGFTREISRLSTLGMIPHK